jgi:hypothetical protein
MNSRKNSGHLDREESCLIRPLDPAIREEYHEIGHTVRLESIIPENNLTQLRRNNHPRFIDKEEDM